MSDLTIEELCIPKKCKDDLVSRREVYKFLLACKTGWDFSQALMNMPSAEPEQRKGECSYKQPCGWCSLFDTPCYEKKEANK